MRVENARRFCSVDEEPLLPRATVRTLGYADQRHIAETKGLQRFVHLGDLAEATVDEQQIRRRNFAILDASVTTLERLLESAVVVAGCDAGDVEAAIFLLERTFR